MSIARPETLAEALDALDAAPRADLLAGGTDLMVEVNFGRRVPGDVIALRRVRELGGWQTSDGEVALGAGLTYTRMERELTAELPALAAAARTVGSPQIRNAGTLGGNLGTASPAGDTLPLLVALDARVRLSGPSGDRTLPIDAFVTGPKRTALGPGELIREVRLPRVRGPQEFLKVGPRNAMVISIACLALVLDLDGRRVRCGLGSVGPVPLRAVEAEQQVSEEIDWSHPAADPGAIDRFGTLVAEAARPITDHRASADYRRHAVGVLARRALARVLASAAGAQEVTG